MAKTEEISLISTDLLIVGDLTGDNTLHIEGRIEGNVKTRTVVIGTNGRIDGSVQADYVEIHGSVSGEINARSVKLSATAHVTGNITHETLSIEPGAVFEGQCRRADGPIYAEGEKTEFLEVPEVLKSLEHKE